MPTSASKSREPNDPPFNLVNSRSLVALLALSSFSLQPSSSCHAQGSLTPPAGPPAPVMKSLQNLWDKLAIMETQNAAMSGQLVAQGSQLDALQEEHAAMTTKLNGQTTQLTDLQTR